MVHSSHLSTHHSGVFSFSLARRRTCFIVLLLCASISLPAHAQSDSALSEDARFWLMTILPGDEIYTTWGHSAIRVQDTERDLDISFNYGTFQFDAYFLPKFLYGELDYMLSVHDYRLALEEYRAGERPVIEQELTLSAAQKDTLFQFLRINARPENRVYRYDFLYDNCSTRIRDVLELSLGDDVDFADTPDPERSFRHLLDPGLLPRPFIDAGIDWMLGSPVDRTALPYETMFLPLYLKAAFDHATIRIDGSVVPLVSRTDTVFWTPDRVRPTNRFPWAAATSWVLLVAGIFVTAGRFKRSGDVVRWFDVPLFTIIGLAGVFITFLWFISLHEVTERNWHLLWSWPTHVVVAAALIRRSSTKWIASYLLAAGVIALVAVALSPLLYQWFHPALYPLMLLVALRGISIFLSVRRREFNAALSTS